MADEDMKTPPSSSALAKHMASPITPQTPNEVALGHVANQLAVLAAQERITLEGVKDENSKLKGQLKSEKRRVEGLKKDLADAEALAAAVSHSNPLRSLAGLLVSIIKLPYLLVRLVIRLVYLLLWMVWVVARSPYRLLFGAPKGGGGEDSAEDAAARMKKEIENEMSKPDLISLMLYRLELILASGNPFASLTVLFSFTAIIVTLGGGVYKMADPEATMSSSFHKAWVLISGSSVDDEEMGPAFVATLLFICGLLFFAMVVGLIGDSISSKVEDLKKGCQPIVDYNHTVVLGWNDKMVSLIKEISLANESLPSGAALGGVFGPKIGSGKLVAILAERDKEEMEADVRDEIDLTEDLKGTMVMFRSGNPCSPQAQQHVNIGSARTVIVLSSDAETLANPCLRMVMAAVAQSDEDNKPGKPMVVECTSRLDAELLHATAAAQPSTPMCVINRPQFIGHILSLLAVRPKALVQVLEELLSFRNSEIYLREWPQLVGKRWDVVCRSFPSAVAIGVLSSTGEVAINPSRRRTLIPGDQIIVVAEDDDSYEPCEPVKGTAQKVSMEGDQPPGPQRVLMVGWRKEVTLATLEALNAQLSPGSSVTLFTATESSKVSAALAEEVEPLSNITVEYRTGNPSKHADLEAAALTSFDVVVVLPGMTMSGNPVAADDRNMSTMLYIRQIFTESDAAKPHQVAELWYPPSRELFQAIDDDVQLFMSSELTAMILAQSSENTVVQKVWSRVLGEQLLNLHRVERYLPEDGPDTPLTFYDMAESVRLLGGTLLGYVDTAVEGEGAVSVNPEGKDKGETWAGRLLVVLEPSVDHKVGGVLVRTAIGRRSPGIGEPW